MTLLNQSELKCGHTAPDWNGKGDCITCARKKLFNYHSQLDEAIQKFAAYARGEGDFDELDLKEVIFKELEGN